MATVLKLPVWSKGTMSGYEAVEAVALPGNRSTLLFTPGFVEGVARGDTIELVDGFPGFRVVDRENNFGIWLWSEGRVGPDDPAVAAAARLAATLGGSVDGGTSKSIVLTVPAATGFERIVEAVDEWTSTHTKFVWQFSNAYDPSDGETPLEWWSAFRGVTPRE